MHLYHQAEKLSKRESSQCAHFIGTSVPSGLVLLLGWMKLFICFRFRIKLVLTSLFLLYKVYSVMIIMFLLNVVFNNVIWVELIIYFTRKPVSARLFLLDSRYHMNFNHFDRFRAHLKASQRSDNVNDLSDSDNALHRF